MNHAQTSTEYLVITAVVIIVAVIVVGVLGGIPGIGGGIDERVSSAQLQTMPLGIIQYDIGESESIFVLRNNQQQNIMVNEIVYGAQTCAVGRTVTPGHEIRVNCDNINSSLEQTAFFVEYQIQQAVYYVSSLGGTNAPEVVLEWVSYETDWFTFSSWQAVEDAFESDYTEWQSPGNAVVDNTNIADTYTSWDGYDVNVYLGLEDNLETTFSEYKTIAFTLETAQVFTVGTNSDLWGNSWSGATINEFSVIIEHSTMWQQYYNGNFSIPSSVRIDGIEVRIRGRQINSEGPILMPGVEFIEAKIYYSLLE
ncbi:MAG: hypothetical protein ACMXYC_02885 [Candidatus Woesearchaeota archaeon]